MFRELFVDIGLSVIESDLKWVRGSEGVLFGSKGM